MVLMPLTIDRFVAVMVPLRHKKWMSHRHIFLLIGFWWMPALLSALYPLTLYHLGAVKVGQSISFLISCVTFPYCSLRLINSRTLKTEY